MSAAKVRESCRQGLSVHGVMIALFGLGRWDISDGLEQAPIVEPVDPFEGGVFNGFKGFPWSSPVDEFGLVETVDGFGQGVVVAVPDTASWSIWCAPRARRSPPKA